MHVCMYAYCTHSRIVHTRMAYITLFYTHRLVWGSYTNVGMVDTCVWARRRACRFVRARMPMRVLSDTCSCWLKSSSRSRVKDDNAPNDAGEGTRAHACEYVRVHASPPPSLRVRARGRQELSVLDKQDQDQDQGGDVSNDAKAQYDSYRKRRGGDY